MKNPLRREPKQVVLNAEQIFAMLELHSYAGNYNLKGAHYTVCGCGKQVVGELKELRHHAAEEISKLQVAL